MTATLSPDAGTAPCWPLAETSLFLDLDGTLVGFQDDPDAVRADPGCVRMLVRGQAALGGRLAVLSGRSIAAIDRIIDGAASTVAGVHGLERRTSSDGVVVTPPHPSLAKVAEALAEFAVRTKGVLVEPKGASVAVHYRRAPEAGPSAIALAERLSAENGLEVQHGAMVAEVKTPGADKGLALAAFMAMAPFAGTRPIFIGDDLTDEAGFREAQARGGAGVIVGDRRETAARGRLPDPDAVRRWIEASLDRAAFDLSKAGFA